MKNNINNKKPCSVTQIGLESCSTAVTYTGHLELFVPSYLYQIAKTWENLNYFFKVH